MIHPLIYRRRRRALPMPARAGTPTLAHAGTPTRAYVATPTTRAHAATPTRAHAGAPFYMLWRQSQRAVVGYAKPGVVAERLIIAYAGGCTSRRPCPRTVGRQIGWGVGRVP
eukprot:355400-Chlamydomonas_euryale.AAC.2